jgi:cell division protein FtsX
LKNVGLCRRFLLLSFILVFTVIAIIIQVLSGFLELLIANLFVPGFAINGVGTYVVLALGFSYCSVEVNLNKN